MNGTPITIVGNLGSDPELRFTPAGVPVASFSVAVAERRLDQATGKWDDAGTTWWRVSCWRTLAEGAAESLTKGARVIVVGTVRSRDWTDTKTGEAKTSFEIQATSVGPDLTWATAKVTRSAKAPNGGPAPEDPRGTGAAVHRTRPATPAGTEDPWATNPQRQQPSGGWLANGAYSDEPPF